MRDPIKDLERKLALLRVPDEARSRLLELARSSREDYTRVSELIQPLLLKEGWDPENLPPIINEVEEFDPEGMPIAQLVEGERLGEDFPIPIGIFLSGHTGIFGLTQVGKSALLKATLPYIAARGPIIRACDQEDEFFPTALALSQSLPFPSFLLPEWKRNFLRPDPPIPLQEHKNLLLSVFRQDLFAREGMLAILAEVLDKLYRRHGVLDGSAESWPDLLHLQKELRSMDYGRGRKGESLTSLKDRVDLLVNNLDQAVACTTGYQSLDDIPIIFRTGRMDEETVRNAFINLELRILAKKNELLGVPRRYLIIIEEAHTFINEDVSRRADLGEHFFLRAPRVLLKRGITLVFVTQTPSDLPRVALSNLENFFIFRLKDPRDRWSVASRLGLSDEVKDELLPNLPRQEFVFMTSTMKSPLHLRVKDLHLPVASYDDLRKYMERFTAGLRYVPHLEVGHAYIEESDEGQRPRRGFVAKTQRHWRAILLDIIEYPVSSMGQRRERLGLTPDDWNKIIKELVKAKKIEEPVNLKTTRGRGAGMKYTGITPLGAEYIDVSYGKVCLPGKGGFKHRLLQHFVACGLGNADVERGGADVVEWKEDSSAVAFEIELEPDHPHVVENVQRNFDNGFAEVVCLAETREGLVKLRDRVQREINFELLHRVRFGLVKDYIQREEK